ncbi:uncharacterized protein ACNS7B_014771 [Menidia menidia]
MAELQQPLLTLAQMLAEMAAMSQDQAALSRQQLGALLAGEERQTQLLEALVVRTTAPPRDPAIAGIQLLRMTEQDDPQSFLGAFEATATACGSGPDGGAESAGLLPRTVPGADLAAAVTLAEDHLAVVSPRQSPGGEPSVPPTPAPRRRSAPAPSPGAPTTARPLPAPRARCSAPPQVQVPAATGAAPHPQGVPQAAGLACWRCGRPGHFRRECPLMEVGQVIRVVGPPAPSPGPRGTYSVPTDASGRGLGAVLSQQVRGVDRPVLYISRKLSDREARYSTVERECLAIRWAVDALRYYLLGRSFTLCSDHAPLQWLHRMKDANARITRWYLALQPFKFRVVHRPGTRMVVADFLSRSHGEGGGNKNCWAQASA